MDMNPSRTTMQQVFPNIRALLYKSRDIRASAYYANNIYGDIEDHSIAIVVTCSYLVHILWFKKL